MLWNWLKSAYHQHVKLLQSAVILCVVSAFISACSADVVRFDAPTLGFGSSDGEFIPQPIHSDGSLFDERPTPSLTPAKSYTTPSAASVPMQHAQLAPVKPAPTTSYRSTANTDTQFYDDSGNNATPINQPYESSTAATQSQVIVQRGDTLYKLARRYNVSIEQIKSANGLTNDVIRPGQILYLSSHSTSDRRQNTTQQTVSQSQELTTSAATAKTYTVKSGETLYAISRRTSVSVKELKRFNNITDPRLLRPGQVLRLSSADDRSDLVQSNSSAQIEADRGAPIVLNSPAQGTSANPRIIEPAPTAQRSRSDARSIDSVALNQPAQTGVPGQSYYPVGKDSAEKNSADQALNFRWPVTGRIIRGFGRRADGTNNDGVNIAVPAGAGIKASEQGTVAYAGDELQGYGNLILIRHASGYISVYAHLDSILIRRGDDVRRGQVIAKAGKTGSVQQPQLHFELRQGAKPIDPMPYLGRM